MDIDTSSDDNSSSECSTDSSDDDQLEAAQLTPNIQLHLPQGLCEHREVFQEFFSAHTWNCLSDTQKQHLRRFLPNFPENDDHEKTVTLQKLFNGEVFRFESPLLRFHNELKAGYFRPDIAKMRHMIRKAERLEAKQRYKGFRERMKQEVIESRRKLISLARNLPPGVEPKVEKPVVMNSSMYMDPIVYRTKRRYFQELATIRGKVEETGFSSDENYPEGPPVPLSRKQKRHLNSIKNTQTISGERIFISTMATKPVGIDLERYITPNQNPFFLNEDGYRSLLAQHKRRKMESPDDPELDTKEISISDIVQRTQLPFIKKAPLPNPQPPSKQNVKYIQNKKKHKREHQMNIATSEVGSKELMTRSNPFFGHSSNSDLSNSDSDASFSVLSSNSSRNKPKPSKVSKVHPVRPPIQKIKTEVKKEMPEPFYEVKPVPTTNNTVEKPASFNSQYGKVTPATFSDLDGIDMMNLPIDLEDSNIDILDLNNKPELMQETHANFLSLIRDIICSTSDHRMTMKTLEDHLKSWQENPISPLNDWYSISDNWVALLKSAVNFLSGNFPEQPEDFVPYIEYKAQLDVYQWIGAGRDSDQLLSPLAQYWLDRKNDVKLSGSVDGMKEKEEIDVEVVDRSQTPPPPRCPTTWTVRKADPEEIISFREQERRRYDNPHKAFTYRCNGYESVVGPLKGIYNPSVGNTKARGHTMLNADRPNFVTILSLVRDATARLPNGEGTRADICELLKSSQYISSNAPDNVLQSVVSGALDRMHTQFDPCVKYDPKRKIWIYLHRNRSEEDFERLHQQYQGMNKNMKKPVAKSRTPTKPKPKVEKVAKKLDVATVVTEKGKVAKAKPTVQANVGAVVATTNVGSPKHTTSVLLTNKVVGKTEASQNTSEILQVASPSQPQLQLPVQKQQPIILTQEDKDINEALQAIVQSRGDSPVTAKHMGKSGKSLVKILSPSQGKSLIIPTSGAHVLKQVQDQRSPSGKQQSQQLVQALGKQTVQLVSKANQIIGEVVSEKQDQKHQTKAPISVQQQILQSITPQQLQNIKNVTLLRSVSQGQTSHTQSIMTPITLTAISQGPQIVVEDEQGSIVNNQNEKQEQAAQVKVAQAAALTVAQQQQILQTLKQKGLPLQLNPQQQQQQVILKQKAAIAQLQLQKQLQHAPGTSLLGQSRIATETINTKAITSSQTPVVAKVLTNAAGQLISVGSLLSHQKQHGTLPQGATLRVASTKGGQANIIQLTPSSKHSPVAQFTVSSPNNFITLTNQQKLVVATSQTTLATATVTNTKPTTKTASKTQSFAKFPPKVTQQLINAKFITQNIDGQKVVQPKLILGQQNQLKVAPNKSVTVTKPVTLNMNANTNTIRMVNATNLNLTHIGGKPVLLAGKGSTIQTIQGQNVILQTQPSGSGNSGIVIQNAAKTIADTNIETTNVNILGQNAQMVITPQLKVQQTPQVVFSSNIKSAPVQNAAQGHLVLGGSPVRLQTSGAASNSQRVVLASSNQGGQILTQQILFPAGFQGAAINIKALQGVKVIPIAQAQHGKGVQGRQVFARLMNPTNLVRASQPTTNTPEVITETPTSTE